MSAMFSRGAKAPKAGPPVVGAQTPLIEPEKPPDAPGPGDKCWRKSRLAFFTVLLLLSSVGNTVFFKRMTSAMPNYGFFLTMLSTVIYVPFFAVLAGAGFALHTTSDLVRKFAIMGVCDGVCGTLMVLGGVHTSGTMQVLLSQAVIPLTMAFSLVFGGKSFHLMQQFGAAVIVLGIVLAKVGSGGSEGDGESDNIVFNIIFVLALVPSALSSVFKEVAFRGFDGDLDVNVLQFWVASFQVIVNLMAMPVYTLKLLGAQQVPLHCMPGIGIGGSRCLFFLEDQVSENCGLPGEKPCDHCQDAWVSVGGYLCFNLMYNISTMLVIKHGSATLAFLVATLRMPLSSLAFASTLIMGSEAVQPSFGDFLSLVVIVCGLVAYRYGAQLLKQQRRSKAAPAPGEGPQSPLWPSPTDSAPTPSGRAGGLRWRLAPLFSTGPQLAAGLQPAFVLVREPRPQPRSAERVRNDLYRRLGAASPLNSPTLRSLTPNTMTGFPSPGSPRVASPTTAATREEYRGIAESRACGSTGSDGADMAMTGLPPQA